MVNSWRHQDGNDTKGTEDTDDAERLDQYPAMRVLSPEGNGPGDKEEANIKVGRDQFKDEGYLILRNVIPPDNLEGMRASCEAVLERQKVVWARQRKPDDPPGGFYETAEQPRVFMERPGLIVSFAEARTRRRGSRFLQVKTLGPCRPSQAYEKRGCSTRRWVSVP